MRLEADGTDQRQIGAGFERGHESLEPGHRPGRRRRAFASGASSDVRRQRAFRSGPRVDSFEQPGQRRMAQQAKAELRAWLDRYRLFVDPQDQCWIDQQAGPGRMHSSDAGITSQIDAGSFAERVQHGVDPALPGRGADDFDGNSCWHVVAARSGRRVLRSAPAAAGARIAAASLSRSSRRCA
ncbi:MAG: hypothetical protein AB7L76_20790 [Burkholderiaceae bacterium]